MTEPKDNDTTAETRRPKRPAAKPASGKSAKATSSSRGSSLRSRLALGAGERKTKRPGGSSGAKTALIALSLIGNVVALSVIGWFLYAKSLPGANGSVVGLKLSAPGAKFRTKEEETARQYVNNMMNFDFHHLDSFNAAMSAGISGDLKKTTGPDQLNAIKQLFTTLEASSQFQIVSSDVIEDKPDEAVVVVAGHQTLNLKGDKGPRSMSTIIKVTVQKKDQSVSGLESLDDLRKSPQDQAPPLFPGAGSQDGQAKQAPKPGQAPQDGQAKQTPKPGQVPQPQGQ